MLLLLAVVHFAAEAGNASVLIEMHKSVKFYGQLL